MTGAQRLGAYAAISLFVSLSGCGGPVDPATDQEGTAGQALAGLPNLRIESVWLTDYCDWAGNCSVIFHQNVCNRGSGTAYGAFVGGQWMSPAWISSCTGAWNAQGSLGALTPGRCIDVIVYGPGYVGSSARRGNSFSYTASVDMYCSVGESNEGDNYWSGWVTVP